MWPLLWVVGCWALKHVRKKRQWQFKECQGDKYVTLNIVKWGKTIQHHSSQLLMHHKHSPMANGRALICPKASWYCIAETLHLGPWVHAGHALFRHHQKGPSWHGWGSPFRRPEPATKRAKMVEFWTRFFHSVFTSPKQGLTFSDFHISQRVHRWHRTSQAKWCPSTFSEFHWKAHQISKGLQQVLRG